MEWAGGGDSLCHSESSGTGKGERSLSLVLYTMDHNCSILSPSPPTPLFLPPPSPVRCLSLPGWCDHSIPTAAEQNQRVPDLLTDHTHTTPTTNYPQSPHWRYMYCISYMHRPHPLLTSPNGSRSHLLVKQTMPLSGTVARQYPQEFVLPCTVVMIVM